MQNNEYNYPIKYGVMPIFEQTTWDDDLDKEYENICNVASVCFLIAETTIFNKDGSCKKIYEVVFPYTLKNYRNDDYEISYPKINEYGQCVNSSIIYEVFDDFVDAINKANDDNKVLVNDSVAYIPKTEQYRELIMQRINLQYDCINKYIEFQNFINDKCNLDIYNIKTKRRINND